MSKFRLIPFSVDAVEKKVDQIPEGVKMIEAPMLWDEGYRGEDVVVAIIDTGVQSDHPDLKDRIIGGINFTTDWNDDATCFEDNNGHGTHVAGTIAAADNGAGVIGVAPKVKLLILKALDRNGSGSYAWITDAIKYATNWKGPNNEHVRVISMSLGGPEDEPEMKAAIKAAVDAQIAVVCAAGNEGDAKEDTFEYDYPGAYNEVIEVAAADLTGKIADFSNNNKEVDVIAPGVNILSTWLKGKYARLSGTSMATPHVAGAMALLIQKGEKEFNRTLTEAEIYALLVKRTVELGYKRSSEGHGLVKLAYMEKVRSLVAFVEENF